MPELVIRIDFPPADRLGRGKADLLEMIRSEGSITAAGRAMGMSYRRAWLLVDTMNRMFSEPVVWSKRGGEHGGGAALTAFGEELLGRYRGLEAKAAAAVADDLAWLAARYVAPPPGEPDGG
ncbi:winged helix-turn-helix domain-containing protein [Methylobrevis albus]|uniref:Winged helix-turn-helix domain-containing protein n=1 Tax=Methylobrevis albus TaxID=2793297 RepID=A0A931MZQ6_9HYPH|nr:winged helix-turn-helix domain-containing protein [Methylobrevis albus]MBH0239260.1 winged helix-turn-helix domain-containing protein [Methylobrevis albus]